MGIDWETLLGAEGDDLDDYYSDAVYEEFMWSEGYYDDDYYDDYYDKHR